MPHDLDAETWMEQAQRDLHAAEHLLEGAFAAHATVLAHLAVEKAMKGIFRRQSGENPPVTHDLRQLAGRIDLTWNRDRQEALDSLRVFLLTFEPGAAVWERFGHNALWIHDPAAGTDFAYHWGLFDMSEEGFLLEFIRGRMVYSVGAADALRLLEAYRRVGRDATVQELALTNAQARLSTAPVTGFTASP